MAFPLQEMKFLHKLEKVSIFGKSTKALNFRAFSSFPNFEFRCPITSNSTCTNKKSYVKQDSKSFRKLKSLLI
jgi:hypothetical protein